MRCHRCCTTSLNSSNWPYEGEIINLFAKVLFCKKRILLLSYWRRKNNAKADETRVKWRGDLPWEQNLKSNKKLSNLTHILFMYTLKSKMNIKMDDKQDIKSVGKTEVDVADFLCPRVLIWQTASERCMWSHIQWDVEKSTNSVYPAQTLIIYCWPDSQGDHSIYLERHGLLLWLSELNAEQSGRGFEKRQMVSCHMELSFSDLLNLPLVLDVSHAF